MKRKWIILLVTACVALGLLGQTAMAWTPTTAGDDGDVLVVEISYDGGEPQQVTFEASAYGPGFYKQSLTLNTSAEVMTLKVVKVQAISVMADGSRVVKANQPSQVSLSFQNALGVFEGVNENGTFRIPVKYLNQERDAYDNLILQAGGSVGAISFGASTSSTDLGFDLSTLAGTYLNDHHVITLHADGTAEVEGKQATDNRVTPIFTGGTVSAGQELLPTSLCISTYDAQLYFTYTSGKLTFSHSGGAGQNPPDYMTAGTAFTLGQLVDKVEVTGDAQGLSVGQTAALTGTVLPQNATEDKTLTWTSSDETVATVDAQGRVTAKGLGVATIRASVPCGVAGELPVTVTKDAIPAPALPDEDILDVLGSAPNQSVEVALKAGTSVSNEVLSALKDSGGSLQVGVVDDAGRLQYQWTLRGEALTQPAGPVDLSMQRLSQTGNPVWDEQLPDAAHLILAFAHTGQLPGVLEVQVDVTDFGFQADDTVTVYYLNPETQQLEAEQTPVTLVAQDGRMYARWTLQHCSSYLLTAQALPTPTTSPSPTVSPAPSGVPSPTVSPTPSGTPSPSSSAASGPKTGDAAPVAWLLLGALAVLAVGCVMLVRRKAHR